MRSTDKLARTPDWQDLDRRHHLHPFTDHRALAAAGSRVITKAEGIYVWDSEGNRILDAMSGLWCVNVGYGRAEIAEAVYRQLLELPYYNTFFQTTHTPAVALSRTLAELTPDGLNHVFYTGSGSEANDTVVRIARRFWEISGQPLRQHIISRNNAYHGSTMASASLGGMRPMHAQGGGLPIPGISHITEPYWYKLGGDLSPDEFGIQAARALRERIEELGVETVAAFIAEPVQGAGGVIVPPDTYWPEIVRICAEFDILLVVDEVICGFGRTGKWFGSDYYQLSPDLMPVAKGLSSGYVPIGGVMVSDRVASALIDRGGEFQHGFTYSGHPVACAAALANLHILQHEGIVDRVGTHTAPHFQRGIRELATHPLVGEVRGIGMLGALELVRPESSPSLSRFEREGSIGNLCRDHCMNNGLIMRAVRDSMILAPPLVITGSQTQELLEQVRHCLDLTARDLGVDV